MTSVRIERVADILERELDTVIAEWLLRVEKDPELMSISMIHKDRTGHLPHLLHDVISRLRLDTGGGRFRRRLPTMGSCGINKAIRWRWRCRNLGYCR
jgi:hypothetical protein